MNTFEEKLAARLIARRGLIPPIDVAAICTSYADLCDKKFPIPIDGLCLDLKVPGRRPKVWVSAQIPHTRRRFTIAHEIGHIVIPWHFGDIVDDVDINGNNAEAGYRKLEAEANRFAAELLMPSKWVESLVARSSHNSVVMEYISRIADVSISAAFIQTIRRGLPNHFAAEVENGRILRSERTYGAQGYLPPIGSKVDEVSFPISSDLRVVSHNDKEYYWWKFLENPNSDVEEFSNSSDCLEYILDEVPRFDLDYARDMVHRIATGILDTAPLSMNEGGIPDYVSDFLGRGDHHNDSVNIVLKHELFTTYVKWMHREMQSA